MLLSEMVRKLDREVSFYADFGEFTVEDLCDWTTARTKTISVSEESWIIAYMRMKESPNAGGNMRILVDDKPVASYGYYPPDGAELFGMCKVAAGSHTIKWQVSEIWWYSDPNSVTVEHFMAGKTEFADMAADSVYGSKTLAPNTEDEIASLTFTTPAQRRTPAGKTKTCILMLVASMKTSSGRYSVVKNPGETDEDDRVNWKIFLNGSQTYWTQRRGDYGIYGDDYKNRLDYGAGAYGLLCRSLSFNTQYTVSIKARNELSGDETVEAHIGLACSPWLIPTWEYEPLSLDFPQGSTLYLTLEPLFSNPTKRFRIGKRRAIRFGDAADFYHEQSGADILKCAYTFEDVEVDKAVCLLSGFGGCVSIVGVDVR